MALLGTSPRTALGTGRADHGPLFVGQHALQRTGLDELAQSRRCHRADSAARIPDRADRSRGIECAHLQAPSKPGPTRIADAGERLHPLRRRRRQMFISRVKFALGPP